MAGLYSREALLRAFILAHRHNTFSHHFIRGTLERELPIELPLERAPASLWTLPTLSVSRDLSSYQRVLRQVEEVRGD